MDFIRRQCPIHDDVGVTAHYKFTGAFDSPPSAHAGVVLEQIGIIADLSDNAACSG